MDGMLFLYILLSVVWGIIWGVAVKKVIENKGYYDNWFWWGFFFGFIALIVALTKPECQSNNQYKSSSLLSRLEEDSDMKAGEIRCNSWKCMCGKVNPMHTGTCDCGRGRNEVQQLKKRNDEIVSQKDKASSVAEEIKKYKELLDIGAITEAEFETKKKELLNL